MRTLFTLILMLCLASCATTNMSSSNLSEAGRLRVLTYNIHHGVGTDKQHDLERIAELINRLSPDLVALQEVDKGVKRTLGEDQPARLAELTGMEVVFVKNINHQGGEYGNAVLSRLPVTHYINHALPKLYPDEQRGMLEVHVDADGQPIVFFATHFDYRGDDSERVASAQWFEQVVNKQPNRAVILAGDLNDRPDSRVIELLSGYLNDTYTLNSDPGYTFPAGEPDRRIDYIFHHTRSGLTAVESRVISEPTASDHRPLLTVFKLP